MSLRLISVFLSIFLLFPPPTKASHHPEEFLRSIQGRKDEGQQIVKHFCSSCHAKEPLIPLGAPRIGQEADWLPRFEQGMLTLMTHTDEGFRAMPPRGGCFECSEEQLLLAILAMLPSSLRKQALTELQDHKKSTKLK